MARDLVRTSKRNMLVRKIQYLVMNSRTARTLLRKISHVAKIAVMGKPSQSGRLPRDIQQGCLAVYVGARRRRFVISAVFLTHPLFKELLQRSEEEFEFTYQGGITISCEPVFFERVLGHIGTKTGASKTVRLDDLLDYSISDC